MTVDISSQILITIKMAYKLDPDEYFTYNVSLRYSPIQI